MQFETLIWYVSDNLLSNNNIIMKEKETVGKNSCSADIAWIVLSRRTRWIHIIILILSSLLTPLISSNGKTNTYIVQYDIFLKVVLRLLFDEKKNVYQKTLLWNSSWVSCETAEIVHLTIVKVGVKYSKHVYFNILEGVNFDLNL